MLSSPPLPPPGSPSQHFGLNLDFAQECLEWSAARDHSDSSHSKGAGSVSLLIQLPVWFTIE